MPTACQPQAGYPRIRWLAVSEQLLFCIGGKLVAHTSLTKAKRRELHLAVGEVHPNVVARQTRELKRGHRRLTRRRTKRTLRPSEIDS